MTLPASQTLKALKQAVRRTAIGKDIFHVLNQLSVTLSSGSPAEVVINEGSSDVDFRVESDSNAYALFVDAGNSRLGVNNSSPSTALDVTGTITASTGLTATTGDVTITAGDLTLTAASDIVIPAATAAALEISDDTTKFYAVDTRVTTVGVTTHKFDISDYTLASASGAVATGVAVAAHTLNYTGTTQVTTQVDTVDLGSRSLVGASSVTVDESNTLHLAPPIEGTMVTLTDASGVRISNAASGTPTNQYGIYIEDLTAGATTDVGIYIAGADTAAIHVASADPILLGTAGTATGKLQMSGATSGTVTLTVGAAAGTWTMQLPAAVGSSGQQLTDAAGDGICTWAAASSLREYKEVGEEVDSKWALQRILETPVHKFRYKQGVPSTGDYDTEYFGVMANDLPEAMHYKGTIVNPISTFGLTSAALKAVWDRLTGLEAKLAPQA